MVLGHFGKDMIIEVDTQDTFFYLDRFHPLERTRRWCVVGVLTSESVGIPVTNASALSFERASRRVIFVHFTHLRRAVR